MTQIPDEEQLHGPIWDLIEALEKVANGMDARLFSTRRWPKEHEDQLRKFIPRLQELRYDLLELTR